MQLVDIEDESDQNEVITVRKMSSLEPTQPNVKEQRRGSSSLLSAAGIGYEQRRKSSIQTQQDVRVFQQGNQVREWRQDFYPFVPNITFEYFSFLSKS